MESKSACTRHNVVLAAYCQLHLWLTDAEVVAWRCDIMKREN